MLVDGVSSICALDFRMDEWGVDVALTGSQKALSMPTGLGIVCASPKALEATKTAKSVRVFFDWKDYLKFYEMGTYWPYTPSIQLLYGLRAALEALHRVVSVATHAYQQRQHGQKPDGNRRFNTHTAKQRGKAGCFA